MAGLLEELEQGDDIPKATASAVKGVMGYQLPGQCSCPAAAKAATKARVEDDDDSDDELKKNMEQKRVPIAAPAASAADEVAPRRADESDTSDEDETLSKP